MPDETKPETAPDETAPVGADPGAVEPGVESVPPTDAAPETQAEAPATPEVEAAQPADDDPEYDYGDIGKMKRSLAREHIDYARRAFAERESVAEAQKKIAEREALIAELGGGSIEEVAKFFRGLDPSMRPYYLQHLAKTTEEFRKTSPVGSMAAQMQALQKELADVKAWREQEMKQRESFFAEQRKQNLSAAFKADKGRDPSKYEIAGLMAAEKEDPGKDGRFYVRALYGGPSTPPVRTGPPGKAGGPSKVNPDNLTLDEIKANQEKMLRSAGFFKS